MNFGSEEELEDVTRGKWRSLILNVDEAQASALWNEIEGIADKMRIK